MRIGIADLEWYNPQRGIGRAITTLAGVWRGSGHAVVPLPSRGSRLPIARNLRWGLRGPLPPVDVLFFGDLLGAESLFFTPAGIPSVMMVHDVGTIDCPEDRAEATRLTAVRMRAALLGARRAVRLVTNSDFTRERLVNHAPALAGRTTAVHLAVDHEVFRPRDRRAARAAVRGKGIEIADEDRVAIYVGAEYRRKNLPGLIEAFARLKSRAPAAKLLKVGAAHDPAAREATLAALRRAQLAPGRDVIFVEGADDGDLAELYAGADLFVTASKYEGFGLPLLEAMACGLPCVVSNAGSLPEVAGGAALLAAPDDVEGIADAMARVLADPGLAAELRARGLARAAQFSWERTASEMLGVLEGAPVVAGRQPATHG